MKLISLLLPDLRGGGAERSRLRLARELARHGHRVELVLVRARGDLLAEAQSEFPVVDLGGDRPRNSLPAVVRYLRQRRPDALLAAMWPLTVIAPIAARIAGFRGKVLISEHNVISGHCKMWDWLPRLALRPSVILGYRLASARIGVSQGVCADIASLSLMSPEQFVTIYNPIPPAIEPGAEQRNAAHALWGTNGPHILTVGRLEPVKNQPLLLRAFAALAQPEARLMLVGQGPSEAPLRTLAADLGIADRVIFAGFHPDPSPFYSTADLFVLSSNNEGFPNVLAEALSFGLPVVSTDCPSGPAEILEGGRYGRLVPVGDAQALTRAMEEALESPVDRDALQRRATEFAPETAARKYLELLL
ncbi:MAG: glycosyl transferase [Thermosynechococcus sp.]|uniref:glycosyltransferase n=1 Tax=Thermosynechococcus sp. TaxID=2814275 RepID=UPI002206A765|nr:glycosyltransferase [Thermosynechococcus sp.]BCX11982.1 MAG: glycosyl transferase [Thermosynechococcus sp.]